MLYTIQKGDTLGALAKRYKTSVSELAKRNGIKNVNRIYAGASLDIPGGETTVQPAQDTGINKKKSWTPESPFAQESFVQTKSTSAPYKSAYADEIDALIGELENREDFVYDHSEDPLYENYRESYTRGGELAMRGSMGEAAALTGGYGSSYAQSVGQQTYQAYMSALSDKVPELASRAYDRYMDEGDALKEKLEAYGKLDAADYAKYRDTAEDELEREKLAYERYRDEQEAALERYKQEKDDERYEREWNYRLSEDQAKAASLKSGSTASIKSDAKKSYSGGAEAEAIYELFEGMTSRERRAILSDIPSIEYMKDVLGENGYEAIKKKYGAS